MGLRIVEGAPAVRAARQEGLGAGVIDFAQLVFHGAVAQRRRPLDVEYTAAAAATETEAAVILEFTELDAHRCHERSWRIVDATFAYQLTRIMECGLAGHCWR